MAQYETEFRQEERRKRKEYGCMDVDKKEPTRRNQAFVEAFAHFVTYKWICRFS